MTESIPAQVAALAANVGGTPIAWHETATGWVIVFEDGRKLTFTRAIEIPTTPAAAVTPPKGKRK